jgi:pimeloyl-ACP methyl ester carboxylesterase
MTAHRVVSRDAVDRMIVTGHRIEVPLDWSRPDAAPTISVFAREVVAVERAGDPSLPMICWYEGGPGFESAYPHARAGWLEQLLTRFRVLLLDQRGTGLSTPLEARALPRPDAAGCAEYLSHFRADAIVRDAERFRVAILGEAADWFLFGQSFGGFCGLTHLSFLPEHLAGVIITGGFAPVLHDADGVYTALADRMVERSAAYHARFPGDVERIRRIVDHLDRTSEVDAHGQRLTARAFLSLGHWLGHAHGFAELHGIIERAASDVDQLGMLGGLVHQQIGELMSPLTNPIYTVLHEASSYAQGGPTRWAASRVIAADPRFALDAQPVPCFTGEMVFPWMFEQWAALRPLREVAELIASRPSWPRLYDVDRLRANRVPVVGTVYWNDPYVARGLALESAELLGNCEVWITNEHEHAAYRISPKPVAERLFAMLDQRRALGRRD